MNRLLLILLVTLPALAQTTYYVDDDADNGGDGTTTATTGGNCAWNQISDITGLSAGDTVLFNRTDDWEETLLVPTAGTDNTTRVTFGAYGTGAAPKIYGAVSQVSTWTTYAPQAIDVGLDSTYSTSNSSGDITYIILANAANLSGTIDTISFYLGSAVTGGTLKVGVFYNTTGTSYICRNVVSLSVTGSDAAKITKTAPGDFTAFEVASGDVVGFYSADTTLEMGVNGSGSQRYALSGDKTDGSEYEFTASSDRNMSIYLQGDSDGYANVWGAARTTRSQRVTFDGTLGTRETSIENLSAEFEWFWEDDILYCYCTADPDSEYTTVNATNGIAIDFNEKNYVSVKNLWLNGATSGIYIDGTDAVLQHCVIERNGIGVQVAAADANVTNCTIYDSTDDGADLDVSCVFKNNIVRSAGYDVNVAALAIIDADTSIYEEAAKVGSGGIYTATSLKDTAVNSGVAIVSPHGFAIVENTGNLGIAGAGTQEYITTNHMFRIRQNGTLKQVKLYCATKTNLTNFYITVWRKDGATYDRVGISEDILSELTAGQTCDVDIDDIAGVQEGDYIGYRVVASDTCLPLRATTGLWSNSTYTVNAAATTPNYDWEAQSAQTYACPIEGYMDKPNFVIIGDSIMSGKPNHMSFVDDTDSTPPIDLDIHPAYRIYCHNLNAYQNVGVSSEESNDVAIRFAADVVALDPVYVVIEGGINDVGSLADPTDPVEVAAAKAEFLDNWEDMLDACDAASIIPVVLLMLPCTYNSDDEMAVYEDWNDALTDQAAGHGNAIVVDCNSYVGQFRPGGAVGNLWDIKSANPDCDEDGVHYTPAGNDLIAEAIYDAIRGADSQLWSTNPSFTDSANSDFTLAVGSPGINAGTDLGDSYDDGMTATGSGDEDAYGTGWEIGAYLYGTAAPPQIF